MHTTRIYIHGIILDLGKNLLEHTFKSLSVETHQDPLSWSVLCVSESYPKHLVEVVILLSSEVEQEGLCEQPGVCSQPQHLQTHTHTV